MIKDRIFVYIVRGADHGGLHRSAEVALQETKKKRQNHWHDASHTIETQSEGE